jgi:broad specificity phosphatase PhoE
MLENIEFNLSLIRHGESAINAVPDLLGQESDTPLTKKGEAQALLLRKKFEKDKVRFDRIYSSSYTRALNTAKIAVPDRDIFITDELREYSAGDWTGGSRAATITPEIKSTMNILDHAFLPPNGESLHQVQRRASKWLEENILYNKDFVLFTHNKKVLNKPILNLACFTHGMTIKCLLHYVMGFDKSFTWKVTIDNTSVSQLRFNKDGWRLLSINDCSHFYLS